MSGIFEHPFWGRGFRPFFFFGALYSVLSLLLWGGFYAGHVDVPMFLLDPISWHAHEMLYGFTMAIIAGFLLTAVANWTGGAPARQIHLFVLFMLWLLGRLVMNVDLGLPFWAVVCAEGMFIPALTLSLTVPLVKSWNTRNFVFLCLLSGLWGADIWFLLSANIVALYVALMLILVMISLVGGRVIPAFTVAALRWKGQKVFQTPQGNMDMVALVSLVALTLSLVLAPNTLWVFSAASISAVIHALRMRHYHSLKSLSEPMLWILHAAYAWLVVGLVLLALTGVEMVTTTMIVHAFTAGCIGSIVLGMLCRVTLGHTGRMIGASRLTVWAFVLIQVTAVLRVFGPLMAPDYTIEWIVGSAGLWALCFTIYLVIYGPMLFMPSPDGHPA